MGQPLISTPELLGLSEKEKEERERRAERVIKRERERTDGGERETERQRQSCWDTDLFELLGDLLAVVLDLLLDGLQSLLHRGGGGAEVGGDVP
jgi:hypothetical protein